MSVFPNAHEVLKYLDLFTPKYIQLLHREGKKPEKFTLEELESEYGHGSIIKIDLVYFS